MQIDRRVVRKHVVVRITLFEPPELDAYISLLL